MDRTRHVDSAAAAADAIVAAVGNDIVLGLPLGLGKSNRIANALFRRAAADSSIRLQIFTALTLETPRPSQELERRFLAPVVERLFDGWLEPAYASAIRDGTLPPNIQVNEFFFLSGKWLHQPYAQRQYVSANYTHAMDVLLARGVNVIAQLVAKGDGDRYSLSCNPDLTLDLLEARGTGRADFVLAGEVHPELPYMPGACEVDAERFAVVLEDASTDYPLFAPPKRPVNDADYATGLHVAGIVPDGGSLQIGIGSIGDGVVQSLILRQRENDVFRATLAGLNPAPSSVSEHLDPFAEGLYGVSEMFVDSFLELIDAGILTRSVDGAVLHAAFFLGPRDFYRRLREMPERERARIAMTSVRFTNALYGDEPGKRAARRYARFINNAMMVTLLGAVVSDATEDGRVVSGVGGQHDFTTQAFALEGARSVITLNATRKRRGKVESNILWSYGHATIPRHLRDLVVTEYGIADLRGRSDRDTIAALLNVADSCFQDELLGRAQAAGKIERDYRIPDGYRDNSPQRVAAALAPAREAGLLPPFPFGTDFTGVEQRLLPALDRLAAAAGSRSALLKLAWTGLRAGSPDTARLECLERMRLAVPSGLRERLYRRLLLGALQEEI